MLQTFWANDPLMLRQNEAITASTTQMRHIFRLVSSSWVAGRRNNLTQSSEVEM
jgi:hypothetical protein